MLLQPYETIVISGVEYYFKLTAGYVVRLEKELDKDLISGLDDLKNIDTLSKYLFYAAKSQNDGIVSINDIYRLIDDYTIDGGTIAELQKLVIDVMFSSGVIIKADGKAAKTAKKVTITSVIEEMYNKAVEVGVYPSEFWKMSPGEIRDIITLRVKQRSNEIYYLSGMIRTAIVSAFSDKVQFPSAPPGEDEQEQQWKRSRDYMRALSELQRQQQQNDNK